MQQNALKAIRNPWITQCALMSLHSCCAPDSSQLSPDLSHLSTSQLQPFQDSKDDMSSGPSCSDYAGTSSGIACAIPRKLGKSSITRVIKSLDS